MTEDKNLKILYQESVESHKLQQSSIDLIYNKLNWILVSDIVFLAAIYGSQQVDIAVVVLVSLSAILSLVGLDPQVFKTTAKLTEQLNKIKKENFLELLIKKKIQAFNANKSRITNVGLFLFLSKWLLVLGLCFQALYVFTNLAISTMSAEELDNNSGDVNEIEQGGEEFEEFEEITKDI